MIKILEESLEHKIICPHCYKLLSFAMEDTTQSYIRGLEEGEGWYDFDCVWNYIECPNCDNKISVDNVLTDEERTILTKKFDR